MLNSAVSLARAGAEVFLISDFADDPAGDLIAKFLQTNGVDCRYVSRYRDGKTALSLAFLTDSGEAEYSFYRIFPASRMKVELPAPLAGDFILFGSNYSLTEAVRPAILEFVKRGRQSGAVVIYDPNFRKPHLGELDRLRPWIIENMGYADIVRGSDEDFLLVAGAADADQAFRFISASGCRVLIYTRSRGQVEIRTAGQKLAFPVPAVEVVSTIGAGDGFNAGVIFEMLRSGEHQAEHTPDSWERIVSTGMAFAGNVCQSLENYISTEFAAGLTGIQI